MAAEEIKRKVRSSKKSKSLTVSEEEFYSMGEEINRLTNTIRFERYLSEFGRFSRDMYSQVAGYFQEDGRSRSITDLEMSGLVEMMAARFNRAVKKQLRAEVRNQKKEKKNDKKIQTE